MKRQHTVTTDQAGYQQAKHLSSPANNANCFEKQGKLPALVM